MRFERFQSIIEYNRKNQEAIEQRVQHFFHQMNMDYERDMLNMMMIVRPLFSRRNFLVLELPFKDQEIGAICYKGDSFGYTFLNSALPKVNVNFALGHEIYHVFYQEEPFKQQVELYINEHYFEHKEELSANLFAGILLMPTPSFKEMFYKFLTEQEEGDSEVAIIVKLMSYFKVPYMAATVRCYELGLLPDGDVLKRLLDVKNEEIEKEFSKLWLDEKILYPTKKDDYSRLKHLVKDIGTLCENEQILSANAVAKVLNNMEKLYKEIRG